MPGKRRSGSGVLQGAAWLAVLPLISLASCKCVSGEGAGGSGQGASGVPLEEAMDLARDSHRAELWRGGLVMDMGTLDQHKYTRGGELRGRFRMHRDRGTSLARVSGDARLELPDAAENYTRVLVRARSARADAKLMVRGWPGISDYTALTPAWKEHLFTLEPLQRMGRRSLELVQDSEGETGVPMEVDWIWLRQGEGQKPDLRRSSPADPRSLLAPPSTRYVFYLPVPAGAELHFVPRADRPTRFSVRGTVDGRPAVELHEAVVKGKGALVRVSLARLAGELASLELITAPAEKGAAGGEVVWSRPRIMAPVRPPRPHKVKAPRAKHMIVIVQDAARPEAFRFYNPEARVATPAASTLALQGVAFTTAYANATFTNPSAASLLTGRYPRTIMDNTAAARLSDSVPTTPEHLRKLGFQTAGFFANPYYGEENGLGRGLEHTWSSLYGNFSTKGDARELFTEVVRWLREDRDPDKRLYLYIHSMDTHVPLYWRPPHTARLLPPGADTIIKPGETLEGPHYHLFANRPGGPSEQDLRIVRAYYLAEQAHHDQHMKSLLDELRRQGILDEALVVFTADHGELLFEHGKCCHNGPPYESVARVPLVLRFPGGTHGGARVEEPVELVDLAPTQLEALGVPPMAGMQGASLMPRVLGGRGAFPDTVILMDNQIAIRLGTYKLFVGQTENLLYDLRTDPDEARDLSFDRPVARRACEVYLGEAMGVPTKADRSRPFALPPPEVVKERTVLDQARIRRLRSLGYLNE